MCKNEDLSVNPSTHTRSQHGFAGLEPSSRAQRQSIPRASCSASPTETDALPVQGETLSQGNKVEDDKGRQPVSCSGSHLCVVHTQHNTHITHIYTHTYIQTCTKTNKCFKLSIKNNCQDTQVINNTNIAD